MSEFVRVAPVGNPGVGKSLVSRYLAGYYGFEIFDGSAFFKSWVSSHYEDAGRRPAVDVHAAFRQANGLTAISDAALKREAERLVYDAPRNYYDFEKFREFGGITIALWCPQTERFRRRNNDPSDPKYSPDIVSFAREEEHEYDSPSIYGCHVLKIMQQADYHVDASGGKEMLLRAISAVMAGIGIEATGEI